MVKNKGKKKKYTNVFRDRFADYYLTNREITKQYDAEHAEAKADGKKASWTGNEKTMLIVTLVAVTLLAVKYLLFK